MQELVFKRCRKGPALHMPTFLLCLSAAAVQRREGVRGAADAGAGPALAGPPVPRYAGFPTMLKALYYAYLLLKTLLLVY